MKLPPGQPLKPSDGYNMPKGAFCIGCGQKFDGAHLDKDSRPKPAPVLS